VSNVHPKHIMRFKIAFLFLIVGPVQPERISAHPENFDPWHIGGQPVVQEAKDVVYKTRPSLIATWKEGPRASSTELDVPPGLATERIAKAALEGLGLKDFEVYSVAGELKLALVFAQGLPLGTLASDLNQEALENLIANPPPGGWHLADLERLGSNRFAAFFRHGSLAQRTELAIDEKNLPTEIAEAAREGLKIADFEFYLPGNFGLRLYDVVFSASQIEQVVEPRLEAEDFHSKAHNLANDYQLFDVESWQENGRPFFAAVWQRESGGDHLLVGRCADCSGATDELASRLTLLQRLQEFAPTNDSRQLELEDLEILWGAPTGAPKEVSEPKVGRARKGRRPLGLDLDKGHPSHLGPLHDGSSGPPYPP
jgi:hypothetical protein